MSEFTLGSLLIVDDEVGLMEDLCEMLSAQGYQTTGCTRGSDALDRLRSTSFDVVLSDLMMPGMDGITLLREGLEIDPHLVGIIMTGQGTVPTAVEAMKTGAFDYVTKPFKLSALLPVVSRAMEMRRVKVENLHLRESVAIYELSSAIAFTLDPSTVLSKVVEAAMQQCEADEAAVLLAAPDGEELYVAAVRGQGPEVLGQRVPLARGIDGWITADEQPHDPAKGAVDPRFWPLRPRPDVTTALSVPMLSGGKLVGVLNVNATRPRRPFTLGQVKALSILASTAASALEAARLFCRVREAEEQYRSLVENASDIICVLRDDGTFQYQSPALERTLGYGLEALEGRSILEFAHPEDAGEVERRFRELAAEAGRIQSGELRFRDTAGGWRILAATGRSVAIGEREVKVIVTARDVTAERQAIEKLTRAEEWARRILETAEEGIWLTDAGGATSFVNQRTAEMLGYEVEEMIGQSILGFVHEEDRSELEGLLHRAAKGQRDLKFRRKDGGRAWTICSIAPYVDPGSGPGALIMVTDITGRKEAETALRDSNQRLQRALTDLARAQSQIVEQERLRALGEMASGIAHDFNNALMPILGFSELLLAVPARMDDRQTVKGYLEAMNTAARDAASVVSRLREFYRRREDEDEFRPLRVDQLVEQAVTLTRPKWKDQAQAAGRTIEIQRDLRPVPRVMCDETQMREVLTNLIFNAVDAMPGGGTIRVTTRRADARAVIEVSDNGQGMSEEVRRRCLEPFFTTKGRDGTGLGLSMVYGIVQRHDGSLEIESAVGDGTTFRISLPLERRPGATRPRKAAERPPRPLRILLLDDEESVLEITTALLEADGHRVDRFLDGEDAVRRFRPELYDVVITDQAMPGMSGEKVAAAVRAAAPGQRVILLTGFGDLMDARGHHPEGVDAVLSKPIGIGALRATLARVVGDGGAAGPAPGG